MAATDRIRRRVVPADAVLRCVRSLCRPVALALACLACLWCATATAADDFPAKPEPARFVNDLAGVFADAGALDVLEDSLARFAYHSSTQVVVVTIADLRGYAVADYAQRLAQQWGVGSSEHDNGALILVKPKTATERGQAFIAVGYGLEGELTDLLCSRIVNDEMIPHFREGDYAGGVVSGSLAVMSAVAGLYEAEPESAVGPVLLVLLLFALFVALVLLSIGSGGTTIPNAVLWGLGGRSSSWGAFSGGSGSFRGGGYGGFGGSFGGGSFGGGGGGGSW